MDAVGRGRGQASGMMLVITNANAEAPKFTLASVETELKGTKVIVVSMATIGEEKVEMKTLDRTGRFVKNDKLIDPKTPFEELLKSITSSAQRTANLKTSHLLIAISVVVHLLCR
uniref:Uncharacterized protein n=1 Tax=Ciona savignyi TaxID=51511 RepID=H2ZAW3_CIOSA